MVVAGELEGQTSIEEALADLGEPWTALSDRFIGRRPAHALLSPPLLYSGRFAPR
ncbi:hypothetical protein [Sinomonas cellulolyticus]|uniref:Uncharacterized protein n=1 Tax=Sinomonas cellulolyticus TaxID=2801916 RepID=A0ABS1JXR1_9MICC|nr:MULTISPECIES: hypothetical protein [Sinomonas]MBL0703990.1 hypothetical protein [Sinomonas cellulolyticus]